MLKLKSLTCTIIGAQQRGQVFILDK